MIIEVTARSLIGSKPVAKQSDVPTSGLNPSEKSGLLLSTAVNNYLQKIRKGQDRRRTDNSRTRSHTIICNSSLDASNSRLFFCGQAGLQSLSVDQVLSGSEFLSLSRWRQCLTSSFRIRRPSSFRSLNFSCLRTTMCSVVPCRSLFVLSLLPLFLLSYSDSLKVFYSNYPSAH